MNIRCCHLGLVIIWGGLVSIAWGHPGEHPAGESFGSAGSRVWTLAGSGLHWEGTLLTARLGEAHFLRDDGSRMTIAMDRLSESDRAWIERKMEAIARWNESPAQIVFVQNQRPVEAAAASGEAPVPEAVRPSPPPRERTRPRPPAGNGNPQQPTPLAAAPPRPTTPAPSSSRQDKTPAMHQHFLPFAKSLGLRWDDQFYYVESQGMPEHPMMIGITAWQQQVPLPQQYTGTNAWRIPRHPVPAKQPKSAKTAFFRGAIALAVNGVPIFNPIKNDGRTDTFLAGELDQWGGHCGRADDYHYHLPPVHLERIVGAGQPIAYALDGYPIYGYYDARTDGAGPLDALNGHQEATGQYHYHATKTYPYLNGGFHGEVVERDGQVDPQPRAFGPRPALPPLRGATITGFQRDETGKQIRVEFSYQDEQRAVSYRLAEDQTVTFTFDQGREGKYDETYRLGSNRQPGPNGAPRRNPNGQGGGNRPGPAGQPPARGRGPARRPESSTGNASRSSNDDEARPSDNHSAQPSTAASNPLPTATAEETKATTTDATAADRVARDAESRGGQRPGPTAGGRQPGPGPRGRSASNSTRRPWIEVHAAEMDADQDHVLTAAELLAESERAFVAYAGRPDQRIAINDLAQRANVRSAMGGFIREHREELDRDRDGSISRDEVVQTARRMFDKADPDGDGRIPIPSRDETQPGTNPATDRPTPTRSDTVTPTRANATSITTPPRSPRNSRPNLIVILMDDMGWRDVGFAGNQYIDTPHIDRLASEGIRFTQAYASAPNCAPTRACLMSGQYTPRHGVYTVVDPRHDPGQPHHRILSTASSESLDSNVVTIAELLKNQGYATACFGMWNLGRGRSGPTTPTGQGFDLYRKPQDLGFEQHAYFDQQGRELTDVLFDEGRQFIAQHQDEPFFLYLPTHAIHAPFDPKPELVEKYRQKAQRLQLTQADPVHAATIETVDQNVGRLLEQLTSLQIDQQTLIIFTSDNGGTPQYVAPLNGSKGALYEGGIRVPCAIWWAGITHPGRTCDEPILSIDFYPTLAALAGVDLPDQQPIDGVSLLPVLQETGKLNREAVFWHFPCYIGRGEPCSAVRSGDWKLLEKFSDNSLELYNLRDDPGETVNLVNQLPDRTRALARMLSQWQSQLNAPRPSEPNPDFDPASVRGPRKRNPTRQGRPVGLE